MTLWRWNALGRNGEIPVLLWISLLLVLFSLVGCQDPEQSLFGGGRVTSAGPNQLLAKDLETFDDARLARLIQPDITSSDPGDALDRALSNFGTSADGNKNAEDRRQRRNNVQDVLLVAAEQRCSLYTHYLRRIDEYTNGTLGIASTIFGGVGAIVTGAEAARVFSGLAGISSGSRAEFNQALTGSVATSVVVPGIEKRRAEILSGIAQRRCNSVVTYTISLAIADAIRYNSACSLDTGLAEAGKAIQAASNPGLSSMQDALAQLKVVQASINDLARNGGAPGAATTTTGGTPTTTGTTTTGTATGARTTGGTPTTTGTTTARTTTGAMTTGGTPTTTGTTTSGTVSAENGGTSATSVPNSTTSDGLSSLSASCTGAAN